MYQFMRCLNVRRTNWRCWCLLMTPIVTLDDLGNSMWQKIIVRWIEIPRMTHSQLLEGLKCESKWKTTEEGGVGMRSLTHNTWRGRGVCWSSGMGLGRIDKLIHSHGPAHNPHKVVSAVGAPLVLGQPRATRTHKTHHGPDLGEATTFPL
jgi:hypothetical protein